MASGGARALLLRAAALGGFTAAAWLLSGATASASPETPVEAPPAIEITAEAPPVADITAEAPSEAATAAPELLEDPAGWAQAFTASIIEKHQPEKLVPPVVEAPVVTEPEEPEEEGPALDFESGSQGNTRYGTIRNEAPPEVVQAKAQVRAAKIAARLAAEVQLPPPPPAPPAPVARKLVPLLPDLPVAAPQQTAPAPVSDLTWSAPGSDAPLPVQQQAPVVATASVSSGHTDNSGGTRGVLAVLTSHNSLFPPTTWSVEERRDGTAPGSIPGLPATSPD
ncbi:hypothetical protein [Lentzea sp. NBRC 102530]|uniref:hypothetical protein n=1 Tax=Lentzea sp. NBRC 102530 TaxID=3032201 RepID=UPI0024A19C0D|nr:hypothetical protein [Lentzea sp. NBRC 102530]GLY53928.1 hypothetical protein Lesp01_75840 [Lentzea sp. NBRC 102530]